MTSRAPRHAWLLVFLGVAAGCTRANEQKRAGHETEQHEDEAHGEHVTLTPEAMQASGIVVAAAGPRAIELTLDLPGEVTPNADRLAHIVPRFPGIAKQVLKTLGEPVRQGEALAIIESNESLSSYPVNSLISGTIIEKHITLGEFVRDDSDVFVVADLSTVWINITIYPRELPHVHRGSKAYIAAVGDSVMASGTIDYVAPTVGEATRAATARLVLPNPRLTWRPGMFVTARVVTDLVDAPVAVPDRAIQRFEEQDCVFVEESEGTFEPRVVRRGRTDGTWTEIVAGLEAGERFVVGGSFIVKSELMKSEAGHTH